MEKPVLCVLAAGMGSRYGGLKQVDPVGPAGEIIIDYSVFDALRAGFDRVVFVIRQDIAEAFKAAIGNRFEKHMGVDYAYQALDDLPAGCGVPAGRQKPWGTGHAVLAAANHIQGSFAVVNADDFYGRESYAQLAAFLSAPSREPRRSCYALAGFTLRKTLSDFGYVSRGICTCDADNRLLGVEELTHLEREGHGAIHRDGQGGVRRLSGDERVSMNMWGFTHDIFEHLERGFKAFLDTHGDDPQREYYLPFAVDGLIREGVADCRVLPTESRWAGVTYKQDRANLQRFIQTQVAAGHYPDPLWI